LDVKESPSFDTDLRILTGSNHLNQPNLNMTS
jgi:hypothetical protein